MKRYLYVSLFLLLGTCALPAQVSTLSDYERKIVAATLVLEATSEGVEGMQAVLNVIYNRAGRDLDRVVGVTVRKGQFSALNSVTGKRNPDYGPILAKAYEQKDYFRAAMHLVRIMEMGELQDNTFGATHYHTVDGRVPNWSRDLRYLTTIGNHRFYTDGSPSLASND